MSTPIRTRFAPSPTGFMHVGGVRTALFAWLVARAGSGQFVLRIEDTDRTRHVEESEAHILECLSWLRLNWDEGPDKAGPHGPYRQSERLDIYKQWAKKLVEAGRAYVDPYTTEQLQTLRQRAEAAKKPFLFREQRPEKPPAWDGSQPLRFKSEPKAYNWHDAVLGDLHAGEEAVDDFVIIKSDGFPTYNFAHIIDDHLMRISHVIRSSEFLASVPRFLNLYEALDFKPPILATPPVVLADDGKKKLSKRDGAKDILDYRQEGYLQEALLNFMATLGWNDGSEQEIFSVKELIKKFDLSRVQRSGAQFDEKRLQWMNGHYIRELGLDELYERAKDFWPATATKASAEYKKQVLALLQERLKYLSELSTLSLLFFEAPTAEAVVNFYENPVDKQLAKDRPDYATMISRVIDALKDSDFSQADITKRLNELMSELKTKPAVLFPVIRIALSASSVSPELFGTLAVLGREESLKRLGTALSAVSQKP